jgi:hypothetical protein
LSTPSYFRTTWARHESGKRLMVQGTSRRKCSSQRGLTPHALVALYYLPRRQTRALTAVRIHLAKLPRRFMPDSVAGSRGGNSEPFGLHFLHCKQPTAGFRSKSTSWRQVNCSNSYVTFLLAMCPLLRSKNSIEVHTVALIHKRNL